MKDRTGKVLRTIGIIFFALATVINLLQTELTYSGILLIGGCVALLRRVFIDVFRQEATLVNLKIPKDP